jgi:hypothetical protein
MAIVIDGSEGVNQSQITGATVLPAGTTAQRPVNPEEGMARYNTDLGFAEFYDGSDWVAF